MNYDFSVLSDIDFEQMVNKLLNGKTRVGSVNNAAKARFRPRSGNAHFWLSKTCNNYDI